MHRRTGTDINVLLGRAPTAAPATVPAAKFGDRANVTKRAARARRDSREAESPTGDWKPLTKPQKAMLSQWARKGWIRSGAQAEGIKLDVWRQQQAVETCGRRISEARQRDYLALKAHYTNLAGESGVAFEAVMRTTGNPERVALFKLREALTEADLDAGYAEAICTRQFRCTIAQASARQIWNLIFTIRNRGNSRKTKANNGTPMPSKTRKK